MKSVAMTANELVTWKAGELVDKTVKLLENSLAD
jgi:hypothetical protein